LDPESPEFTPASLMSQNRLKYLNPNLPPISSFDSGAEATTDPIDSKLIQRLKQRKILNAIKYNLTDNGIRCLNFIYLDFYL